MERRRWDVVLVTPTSVSANPRTVKEADALSAAGYRVAVVCAHDGRERPRREDGELVAARSWEIFPVRFARTLSAELLPAVRRAVRMRVLEHLPQRWSARRFVASRLVGGIAPELAARARRLPAKLYIGHYPAGLAAAARVAREHRSFLGYDIEDLHVAEEPDSPGFRRRARAVEALERDLLPLCAHLTAVSEGVAEEIAKRYGPRPLVVHNAFPWSDRERLDGRRQDRKSDHPSLCWVSQVVGLDRGLQEVIAALGRVRAPFELHIRGTLRPPVVAALEEDARRHGIADRVFFHEWVCAAELLSRIAEHDIGLAPERLSPRNRALTVTNKVFLYLLAGLAVVGSDTPGQRRVSGGAPGAFHLYRPGAVGELAARLQGLLSDPEALWRARAAALEAARTRWNWEREAARLLASVERILGPAGDGEGGRRPC